MATKYARAGGGNWSADATWSLSSGGLADTVAPTAADDVILDGASGNVTIDAGAIRLCRSLDCFGYTGTLTHNAVTNLDIGDGTVGTGNRALRLAAGMTYSSGANATIRFVSTAAGTQTATWAGKAPWDFTVISGATSVVQFTDTLSLTGTILLTSGTLDTNNQAVTAFNVSSSNSNARTLTLGSSAITLSLAGVAWSCATVTNLTVTANTATVTLTGGDSTFSSGGQNWNGMSVVMSGSGVARWSVATGCIVQNLTRTGTAVKTDAFRINAASTSFTVAGTFTATGNSATNRLLVYFETLGTARTITAAAVSLTNVDFRDITAAGAAIPWTGTSLGDALGNTNITFDAPTTRYGVGTGTVSWSSTAMWSASSGGASGASVPLCQDTVILNASSTSGTISCDMPRYCADLIMTGFVGTLATGTGDIYGSVTLASGMTFSSGSRVTLRGRSSQTLTSAGKAWNSPITIDCATGTYTLVDAIAVNNASGIGMIALTSGTFTDSGFSVTLTYTGVTTGSDFTQTGGTLNATGTWTLNTGATGTTPWTVTSGTVNASTAALTTSNATATDRTFAGGGKVYGTLTDQNTSTGKLTITGANTFTTINKTATVACTLTLPSATTTTVTNFNVNGIAGNLLTLNSSTPASAAILSKPTGLVSCDYLSIQDSTATGGARFFAGTHSTNVSNNTGWNFIAPTYNTSSTGIIA